jgi:putative Mg2+ transporter-C (MgtC) family protein
LEKIIELFVSFGLTEFQAVALVKTLLASLCGGLIGLEREMKGRPAGLKTFSLVCLGSTLAMITNDYIYTYIAGGSGDAARMAAQVISGIGFLGAGTIMVTGHNQIKGLTTAAALWVTAALGISIGCGFYFGGFAGLVVIYITSFIYRYLDSKIMKYSRIMRIYVEGTDEEFMLKLSKYIRDSNFKVLTLQRKSENKWFEDNSCAMIGMDLGKRMLHSTIMEEIKQIEGLCYIEEI